MKSIHFLSILLISFCSYGFARSGTKQYTDYSKSSHFEIRGELNSRQIENIEVLGQVWGYVKYHHPVFVFDSINADFEFFELLSKAYDALPSDRNLTLLKWINSLGCYTLITYDTSDYTCINDFSWINNESILGAELSLELRKLRFAERNENKYVTPSEVHLLFNENAHENLNINQFDIGYRILGVVRYWNIVACYSPNRNITDKEWCDVLPEFIEKAANTDINNYELFASLVSQLNDTHAYTPNTSILGSDMASLVVKFAEERMFITDTCSFGNVRFSIGDEIIAIDGVAPAGKLPLIDKYTSHSNRDALIRDASYMAFLTKDSLMNIRYIHKGLVNEITAPTVSIGDFVGRIYRNLYPSQVETLRLLSDSIAYLNIGSLKSSQSAEIYDVIKNIRNLIVDLRTYPADYNAKTEFFGRYFVSKSAYFIKTLKPIAELPGFFQETHSLNSENKNENAYKGNIIILVNAQTQSMGEYFAMLLQSIPGTVTVGSCTAGADGNISKIIFPYDITSCITGIGAYYPDGTNAQRQGVKIDYMVYPTPEGMKAGKDEVLEKALTLIHETKVAYNLQ